MSDRKEIQARIVPDLLNIIEATMGAVEGHRGDVEFLALCNRIQGKIVTLVFTGPDAFEKADDNYWLPRTCWEPI